MSWIEFVLVISPMWNETSRRLWEWIDWVVVDSWLVGSCRTVSYVKISVELCSVWLYDKGNQIQPYDEN